MQLAVNVFGELAGGLLPFGVLTLFWVIRISRHYGRAGQLETRYKQPTHQLAKQ